MSIVAEAGKPNLEENFFLAANLESCCTRMACAKYWRVASTKTPTLVRPGKVRIQENGKHTRDKNKRLSRKEEDEEEEIS